MSNSNGESRAETSAVGQSVVVGASLAGLDLARTLADGGGDVVLFERGAHVDPSRRTLIVTSRSRDTHAAEIESALTNEIRRYELFANGSSAEIILSEPDLVIERAVLAEVLARSAAESGVRFEFGHRFEGFHPADEALRLRFAHDSGALELSTQVLVGADGVNSSVARGAGWPKLRTVPVLQAVIALPPDLPTDTTRVWFRPQDTPYFYWLIPEGSDRGVLGLIAENPHAARVSLDGFLAEKGWSPLAYQAARIPAYKRWRTPHRRIAGSDVFLVGDAAGHVKVSTVGGIHTGFRGAKAIAEVMTAGDRTGLRSLRRELGRHLLLRRALNHFSHDDYGRLLDVLGGRARQTLSTHTRDDSRALLVKLALTEPRLILIALRSLLTRGSSSSAVQAHADQQQRQESTEERGPAHQQVSSAGLGIGDHNS